MTTPRGADTAPLESPTLVVIRGNSGCGKTTIARRLQRLHGRGAALIELDYLRRVILRERDIDGGIAPSFVEHTALFALRHQYHVIIEGILARDRYGEMLQRLADSHPGRTAWFYLDASFEETARRHAAHRQTADFTIEDMRGWYRAHDVLGVPGEMVIGQSVSEAETVARIAANAGLELTGDDRDFLPARQRSPAPR